MLFQSLVWGLLALLPAQSQPPKFRAVPLESLGGSTPSVVDINERGVSVGTASSAGGAQTAACWDSAGKLTVLGRKSTLVTTTVANAINDAGVVAGGVFWRDWTGLPAVWILPNDGQPLAWPRKASAFDVNARGDLLLRVDSLLTQGGAILKRDGSTVAVLNGQTHAVRALADDGRVCGERLVGSVWVAFRWSEQVGIQDLEMPQGIIEAVASGIRDDGEIVTGYVGDSANRWPVTWDAQRRIRYLPPSSSVQSDEGYAEAVNASGWVVGSRILAGDGLNAVGTLWFEGVSYELEDLIVEGLPMKVLLAHGLNDQGQIVGLGMGAGGTTTAIRLDPL